MNAHKFVADFGIERAKAVLEGAPDGARVYVGITKRYFSSPSRLYDFEEMEWEEMDRGMDLDLYEDQIWLEDLKRLVESVDLVKSYGGVINAQHEIKYLDLDWDYDSPRVVRLKQAIADYESIYSDSDMGDDSHIENHVSPLCKVEVK